MLNLKLRNFFYALVALIFVLAESLESFPQNNKINNQNVSRLENEADERINGGEIVQRVVPYQISMQMRRGGKWRHFCSGSIISAKHVLTAAHCVNKIKNIKEISVVAGTLTWQDAGAGGGSAGHRHMLVAKHVHPNFTMDPQIVNDIAIVKVSPSFNLQRNSIAAINLGRSLPIGDRIAVRVTGWGSTAPTISTAHDIPARLQSLDYYTITNEHCGRRGFQVTANELCALAPKGKGACMGDSGGPLVTLSGTPQLVGLVSYGSSKCAQGRPDVYTRISSFLPYISQVMTKELP